MMETNSPDVLSLSEPLNGNQIYPFLILFNVVIPQQFEDLK